MNLVTKLGVVTLAAITVAPLATSTISPVNAQAKTVKKAKKVKIYKINKNVLKSKKNLLNNYANSKHRLPIAIMQRNKKVRIVSGSGSSENTLDYKVLKQSVKKNKMTLKLSPILTKKWKKYGLAKGTGTIQIIRTGKNAYMIPKIYALDAYRVNGHKYQLYNAWNKPKKVSVKSMKVSNVNSLFKSKKYNMYKPDFKF